MKHFQELSKVNYLGLICPTV